MSKTQRLIAVLLCAVATAAHAAPDVTGQWQVHLDFDLFGEDGEIWDLVQTGTQVDLTTPGGTSTGTIDLGTGEITIDLGPSMVPFCPHDTLVATLDAGNVTFAGARGIHFGIACYELPENVAGERCLNSPLDPGEGCETASSLISGARLVVRDGGSDATQRRLTFVSRDASLVPSPRFAVGDPARWGATLVVARGTAEVVSIAMPASHWTALGTPAGSAGYRYRDTSQSAPCTSAVLRTGLLRVVCKGSDIAFTLDEPAQGALAVTFIPGHGVRACSEFSGAAVRRDTSTSAHPVGIFRARNAVAPSACTPLILPQ